MQRLSLLLLCVCALAASVLATPWPYTPTTPQDGSFYVPTPLTVLTAEIEASSLIDSGFVAFFDNNVLVPDCSNVPVSQAMAYCETSFPISGLHAITAVYTGDESRLIDGSKTLGSTDQLVKQRTRIVLTPSEYPTRPAALGYNITAVVYDTKTNLPVAKGSVAFTRADDNESPIRWCESLPVVSASGSATCEPDFLKPDIILVRAVYTDATGQYQTSESYHRVQVIPVRGLSILTFSLQSQYSNWQDINKGTVSFNYLGSPLGSYEPCDSRRVRGGEAYCPVLFHAETAQAVITAVFSGDESASIPSVSQQITTEVRKRTRVIVEFSQNPTTPYLENFMIYAWAKDAVTMKPVAGKITFRLDDKKDGNGDYVPIEDCASLNVDVNGMAACMPLWEDEWQTAGTHMVIAEFTPADEQTYAASHGWDGLEMIVPPGFVLFKADVRYDFDEEPDSLDVLITETNGDVKFVDIASGSDVVLPTCAKRHVYKGYAFCPAYFDNAWEKHNIVSRYLGEARPGQLYWSDSAPLTHTIFQRTEVKLVSSKPDGVQMLEEGFGLTAQVINTATQQAVTLGHIAINDQRGQVPVSCNNFDITTGSDPSSTVHCNFVPTHSWFEDEVTAVFTPDNFESNKPYAGSSASLFQNITLVPGQLVLSAVLSVDDGTNAMTPATTGKVTFSDNGVVINTCKDLSLDVQSSVSCVATITTAGRHTISASYSGDANNQLFEGVEEVVEDIFVNQNVSVRLLDPIMSTNLDSDAEFVALIRYNFPSRPHMPREHHRDHDGKYEHDGEYDHEGHEGKYDHDGKYEHNGQHFDAAADLQSAGAPNSIPLSGYVTFMIDDAPWPGCTEMRLIPEMHGKIRCQIPSHTRHIKDILALGRHSVQVYFKGEEPIVRSTDSAADKDRLTDPAGLLGISWSQYHSFDVIDYEDLNDVENLFRRALAVTDIDTGFISVTFPAKIWPRRAYGLLSFYMDNEVVHHCKHTEVGLLDRHASCSFTLDRVDLHRLQVRWNGDPDYYNYFADFYPRYYPKWANLTERELGRRYTIDDLTDPRELSLTYNVQCNAVNLNVFAQQFRQDMADMLGCSIDFVQIPQDGISCDEHGHVVVKFYLLSNLMNEKFINIVSTEKAGVLRGVHKDIEWDSFTRSDTRYKSLPVTVNFYGKIVPKRDQQKPKVP